jgi:hypothetical protein
VPIRVLTSCNLPAPSVSTFCFHLLFPPSVSTFCFHLLFPPPVFDMKPWILNHLILIFFCLALARTRARASAQRAPLADMTR